jgi:LmbE family N-acetylglucosaminyl deacetylase
VEFVEWFAAALGTVLCVVLCCWVWVRRATYQRHLNYASRADYHYRLGADRGRPVPVVWGSDGFATSIPEGASSSFVKVRIVATWRGQVADPYLELACGERVARQYFERGAGGVRCLNLSGLVRGTVGACQVRLRGRGCRWYPVDTALCAFDDSLRAEDRVVVVAPHPDDAEIAAFGVYSSTDAAVVTVTAGDASDRYGGVAPLTRNDVARLRVWDSITVPRIGGVPPQRAINLAYPDGRLAEMAAKPDCDVRGELEFDELRAINLSDLVRGSAVCSWESLVEDLAHVFTRHRPTAIVTPSPTHDSHSDHRRTTFAVCRALSRAGLSEGRLFLPVIHNRWTELYPFGPATAVASLPPNLDPSDGDWDGICSYPLSVEQQALKYMALEAMHDLREFRAPFPDTKTLVRRSLGELKAALHGMGTPPTSYLRRGPRPDEVFFVLGFRRALELLPTWEAAERAANGGAR